jgi:hypothetical protein
MAVAQTLMRSTAKTLSNYPLDPKPLKIAPIENRINLKLIQTFVRVVG